MKSISHKTTRRLHFNLYLKGIVIQQFLFEVEPLFSCLSGRNILPGVLVEVNIPYLQLFHCEKETY